MTRIVQVANFVTDSSGGLRTTLRHLAAGYGGAGHEVVQVLPGARDMVAREDGGLTQIWLAAPAVPGTGYRLHWDVARVRRTVAQLEPDVVEVHDRTTLRGLGKWANSEGVLSCVVSHERLDRWLRQWLPRQMRPQRTADRSNESLAANFDTVVCTTEWAAEEFVRIGVSNLRVVPLGVDLAIFAPRLCARSRDEVVLIMASRLSKEKRPDLAVGAVRELVRRKLDVRLVVCGDGPMRRALWRQARELPIEWQGYVADPKELASLLAGADIALAPGPIETFGLAALEALACGTPVVANRNSALPAIIGAAGRAVPSSGWCIADAVEELLDVDEVQRRRSARRRAEHFDWDSTVRGFLAVHRLQRHALAA